MLRILAIVGGVIVVAIGGVLIAATTVPDTFAVARSAAIKAPPEAIFPLVNDLRRFGDWSPYDKRDPAMKRAYDGPASGTGAAYAWEGNDEVGAGRMEITESVPPAKVSMDLRFTRPFPARNAVDFTFVPKGEVTDVTWAMHGPVPFLAKIVHLFMDMDGMVGGDFEAGLANLKRLAEGPPPAR